MNAPVGGRVLAPGHQPIHVNRNLPWDGVLAPGHMPVPVEPWLSAW